MNFGKTNIKYIFITIWIGLLASSLYSYFFIPDFFQSHFTLLAGKSVVLMYIIYLIACCLRGFTLIPITYFIIVGVLIIPPLPLYIITLIGVICSSACVYYFSEYLNFDEYFEKKHSKYITKIKSLLEKNELPIVIIWSFMPFLPTDLICYVCGTLRINIKKFLLGVVIGEGVSCAIYIFFGKEILNYLKF